MDISPSCILACLLLCTAVNQPARYKVATQTDKVTAEIIFPFQLPTQLPEYTAYVD